MGGAMGKKIASASARGMADQIATMIEKRLPSVSLALQDEPGSRPASISFTCSFTKLKNDEVEVKINPRERIPLKGVKMRLTMSDDGQLDLLDGTGHPEEMPEQPAMDDETTGPITH